MILWERSCNSTLEDAARITTVTIFCYCRATSSVIDHYEKMADQGRPVLHVVFTR